MYTSREIGGGTDERIVEDGGDTGVRGTGGRQVDAEMGDKLVHETGTGGEDRWE